MRKNRLFYNIQKNADSADIFIYGIIGWDWYDSGNTAKQFLKDFKALEDTYSRINVRINSPGGDIHEGLPIANAIRASKKDVHTYIDGIAYSMGAIIAISGKTVHIASNGLMMLHNASTIVWGNAEELHKAADDLAKYDDALMQTVADKTGKDKESIKADWFNFKDNYFTASEALDAKLVDHVEDYKAEDMPDNIADMDMKSVFAKYSQMNEEQEESFMDKVVEGIQKRIGNLFTKESIQPQESNDMDFKKTLAVLNNEKATKEERDAAIAEVAAFTGAAEKFTQAEVDAKVKAAEDASAKKLKDAQDALEKVTNEFNEFKSDKKSTDEGVKQEGDDRQTQNQGELSSWEKKAQKKTAATA